MRPFKSSVLPLPNQLKQPPRRRRRLLPRRCKRPRLREADELAGNPKVINRLLPNAGRHPLVLNYIRGHFGVPEIAAAYRTIPLIPLSPDCGVSKDDL